MTKISLHLLSAFKDGVADALLDGSMSEYHKEMHYYKKGYDFGLIMYSELYGNGKESQDNGQ
jgi:hypothetical protein